jgi:hypothetical protein
MSVLNNQEVYIDLPKHLPMHKERAKAEHKMVLSSWMLRIGGKRVAETDDSGGGVRDPSYMLAPSSNASNKGTHLPPTNS